MRTPVKLPDTQTLTRGLNVVFESTAKDQITVVGRKLHSRASTFPLEIVTCRFGDGQMLSVACKYSADRENRCYGHRGGVPYEAEVNRSVLGPRGVSAPHFHGTYQDPDTGWIWLVIDYLENATTSGETKHGLESAANWLGRFHAAHEGHMAGNTELHTYDLDYYIGWAERTMEFTRPFAEDLPWLAALCTRFKDVVPVLLDRPATIIHGEFFQSNVLVEDGVTYPVDWEAAAVGPGEIDLASVTDKWPAATVDRCIAQYQEARWPNGAPADLEMTLDVARVYWLFRWLGDTPARTQKRLAKRVDQLRSTAERWGVL